MATEDLEEGLRFPRDDKTATEEEVKFFCQRMYFTDPMWSIKPAEKLKGYAEVTLAYEGMIPVSWMFRVSPNHSLASQYADVTRTCMSMFRVFGQGHGVGHSTTVKWAQETLGKFLNSRFES